MFISFTYKLNFFFELVLRHPVDVNTIAKIYLFIEVKICQSRMLFNTFSRL